MSTPNMNHIQSSVLSNSEIPSQLTSVNNIQLTTTSHVTPQIINTDTTIQPVEIQPKRLHVSNIPFRFRDPDLRAMFGVSHANQILSSPIL